MADRSPLPQNPREAIVAVGKLLHAKGLIAAKDGNISVSDGETIWITPSGSHKGFLEPEDIILCDMEGRVVFGSGRPSTEMALHLTAYRTGRGVKAVIHAHPPLVVAFSVAGLSLDAPVLPETVMTGPPIPTAPYAPPGTDRAVGALAELLPDHPAVVLDRHGTLTVGPDLIAALSRLEQMEYLARVIMSAKLLGRVQELDPDQVAELLALGRERGFLA